VIILNLLFNLIFYKRQVHTRINNTFLYQSDIESSNFDASI